MIAPRYANLPPRSRPEACGKEGCGQKDLTPHCELPACPWVYCPVCNHTTGIVLHRPAGAGSLTYAPRAVELRARPGPAAS